jgi:alanyl-tRNA synthetase
MNNADFVRSIVDDSRNLAKASRTPHVVLLGTKLDDGKGFFICDVPEEIVAKGLTAVDVIRYVTRLAGGGGGGSPTRAEGGCKDGDRVDEAIKLTKDHYVELYGLTKKDKEKER